MPNTAMGSSSATCTGTSSNCKKSNCIKENAYYWPGECQPGSEYPHGNGGTYCQCKRVEKWEGSQDKCSLDSLNEDDTANCPKSDCEDPQYWLATANWHSDQEWECWGGSCGGYGVCSDEYPHPSGETYCTCSFEKRSLDSQEYCTTVCWAYADCIRRDNCVHHWASAEYNSCNSVNCPKNDCGSRQLKKSCYFHKAAGETFCDCYNPDYEGNDVNPLSNIIANDIVKYEAQYYIVSLVVVALVFGILCYCVGRLFGTKKSKTWNFTKLNQDNESNESEDEVL